MTKMIFVLFRASKLKNSERIFQIRIRDAVVSLEYISFFFSFLISYHSNKAFSYRSQFISQNSFFSFLFFLFIDFFLMISVFFGFTTCISSSSMKLTIKFKRITSFANSKSFTFKNEKNRKL